MRIAFSEYKNSAGYTVHASRLDGENKNFTQILVWKITEDSNIDYRQAGSRKILKWLIRGLTSVIIQEAALKDLIHVISKIKVISYRP